MIGVGAGLGVGYLIFGLPWRNSGGVWLGENGGGFWLGRRKRDLWKNFEQFEE